MLLYIVLLEYNNAKFWGDGKKIPRTVLIGRIILKTWSSHGFQALDDNVRCIITFFLHTGKIITLQNIVMRLLRQHKMQVRPQLDSLPFTLWYQMVCLLYRSLKRMSHQSWNKHASEESCRKLKQLTMF